MKREITNYQLLLIEDDVSALPSAHPGLYLFHAKSINQFYQRNGLLLKILHGRLHEMQVKYIEHDGEGKPLYANEEKTSWKWLDSVASKTGEMLLGDEVAKAYQEEFKEFMGRSITIEL